jgi:hypothetical protein
MCARIPLLKHITMTLYQFMPDLYSSDCLAYAVGEDVWLDEGEEFSYCARPQPVFLGALTIRLLAYIPIPPISQPWIILVDRL